ncbi:MAG: BolA family protein [Zetaproteobacteria bacterium CG06_land_8_20_14_3_00_59_53]|nr:MAG: hypothetical protein AUK36_05455 [Zetaproteobacteria bacterium CG2_30_59_37]PIO90500.1 MAG: BolA family protein [Zetaproteobacteria bacterium CG23_combo_of_CG06-09_8_20_14_all_59_86]PIQ65971.1 MAG: BolA family protein [Zetaproteobacteria bacterium CG11_big_fil_rev_8_21_14_0_20_59_439]PIU71451.1 MAG: BolA family protein [Zetaproteobacteria bacterium CG06_land_8_20_14_3_00_59_53]PIU97707.1 MAG: BolA family protein [Zetaproteobacteria bacterium CG03_land_8_20_14_0_80_59_51]PIY47278.1 MAG:
MEAELVRRRILGVYGDAKVFIEGEGCSLEVRIISDGFTNMPVLNRQKSIMKLFETELASGALHALSIKARTPAEANASVSGLVQLDM